MCLTVRESSRGNLSWCLGALDGRVWVPFVMPRGVRVAWLDYAAIGLHAIGSQMAA